MENSEQSSGAWRILKGIFTVLAVLVVLAALAVVGYETWRQQDIRKARAEQEAAIAKVNAHFSDVKDWRAWWHGRVDGTWGGDEFQKWAESANADDLAMAYELADSLERQLAGIDDEFDHVSKAELTAYLERTSELARESDEFLQYDHLSGVPLLDEDGVIEPATWLDSFAAMNALHLRVRALTWLERYDEAWDELSRLNKLTRRYRTSYCVLEHLLNSGQYVTLATTLEYLAMRSTPPEALVAEFPLPEATLDRTHVLEGELAYSIQYFRPELESEDDEEWRYDDEDWFSWFTPDGWESAFGDDISAAEIYRFSAATVLSALELYEAARDEREPQGLEEAYDSVWMRLDVSDARRNIYRQRANLVVALRAFEAEGNPLSEFAFDAESYPDLTLRHTEDGAEIQFADTERVRLATDMDDPEYKPATLPPLNGE